MSHCFIFSFIYVYAGMTNLIHNVISLWILSNWWLLKVWGKCMWPWKGDSVTWSSHTLPAPPIHGGVWGNLTRLWRTASELIWLRAMCSTALILTLLHYQTMQYSSIGTARRELQLPLNLLLANATPVLTDDSAFRWKYHPSQFQTG